MMTVSDRDKLVMVWGNPQCINSESIASYQSKGYRVVRFSNGTGGMHECLKAVIRASGLVE